MNTLRVNRRSVGINFSSRGESEVMVWAPFAKEVSLVMTNTNERIALIGRERGYFSCITPKLKPGDRYMFEIDQDKKYPDPASLYQPEGVSGPSEVVNIHHHHWNDGSWKNIPLKDYIFYELHTGTFSASGTFEGIEQRLDHLRELGITAIEIMPVAEFSGIRNWGYDGVLPYAVHHAYGGPAGLQRLIDKSHEYGIAVVLDVVYNHMGPEGNILGQFGPYFTDKYKTPWGSAVNFDDGGSDEVRKFFIENVLMWFRDFHIDALRVDAVHAIRDFGATHILQDIRAHVDELTKETGRVHYLIAECDLNDPKYIRGLDETGYGMDAQWIDEFHHALRVASGNERRGYYEDFNGLFHLGKSFKDAFVYDGSYSHHRQRTFGAKANGIPGEKFIVFSQNHDQVGNRMLGERSSALVGFEMQKLMAATVMFSPFLPMLFMGEEYGETNPFLYFVDHSDEELIAAVRKGRKEEFKSFHNGEDVPDPQSKETFHKSKLQWHLLQESHHQTMLGYYRNLITVRKKLKVLFPGIRENIEVKVFDEQQLLVVRKWVGDDAAQCILNFSKAKQQVTDFTPDNGSKLVLNSAATMWNGPGGEGLSINQNGPFVIGPESFMLFTNIHV